MAAASEGDGGDCSVGCAVNDAEELPLGVSEGGAYLSEIVPGIVRTVEIEPVIVTSNAETWPCTVKLPSTFGVPVSVWSAVPSDAVHVRFGSLLVPCGAVTRVFTRTVTVRWPELFFGYLICTELVDESVTDHWQYLPSL